MTITFRSPIKRHYTLAEVQQQMANELSDPRSTNISEFLRKESTGASFGNIDASDLKPPQLKLLAGQSPEVLDGVPGAVPGNFWITILNVNLGPSVVGSPILLRKSYQVWNNRKRQDQTRRDRLRSLRTASTGTSRINRLRLSFSAIHGPTFGSLAAPSRRRAHTSSVQARTTTSHPSPSPRSLTIFCGASICPMGRSSCACLKRRARASSLLRISSAP